MSKTTIEWTEHTANPIIGCSKCSPACDNCDALSMARRFAGMKGPVGYDYRRVVTDGEWNGKTVFITEVLDKIIKRKKPTTYFVGSMTDIFHESVPFEWIHVIWDVMKRTPQHRYMILTKRPQQMNDIVGLIYRKESLGQAMGFWSHVALGVSVWDQDSADHAIPLLLQTPAARRFVSAGPLLGTVDLRASGMCLDGQTFGRYKCYEHNKIDLVIVGGETGPKARPMHPEWVRALRDQCAAAGVPFMFEQWGEWLPGEATPDSGASYRRCDNGEIYATSAQHLRENFGTHQDRHSGRLITLRVGKKAAGRLLDGVEHNGVIQWEA